MGRRYTRLSNVCGSLEVGKDADLSLADLDQPQLTLSTIHILI